MKVIQLAETLAYGDAMGNHILMTDQALRRMGIKSTVYAVNIHGNVPPGRAKKYHFLTRIDRDDILMFHMGIGTSLIDELPQYRCRKIMVYHNITPPDMTGDYDTGLASGCAWGYRQMGTMQQWYDGIIAMSAYNKRDLIQMGYPGDKIWVMPAYFIPFTDYRQKPAVQILKDYGNKKNILFVGRWAPNKKHEDMVQIFTYYQRNIDPDARLILAGSGENGVYANAVKEYIQKIGTRNVIFPGHISFSELIAFYKTADVFLCMSEHEGFCVPLVEAMYFHVPILAYAAAAVPETLCGSGMLVAKKDPVFVAKALDRLMHDENVRAAVLEKQQKRLRCFEEKRTEHAFQEYMKQWVRV